MTDALELTCYRWMRALNLRVSRELVREQILSHSSYPSLVCVTDLLDDIGVDNGAFQVDKKDLPQVPVPFVAHMNNGNGLVLIKRLNRLPAHFFESWSGTVIAAEVPSNGLYDAGYITAGRRTTPELLGITLALATVICSLFAFVAETGALFYSAIAAAYVSWLLVGREFGFENDTADWLCGKEEDCKAVAESKGATWLGLKWSDIGLLWFCVMAITIGISDLAQMHRSVVSCWAVLVACAIPFTFFSVYYQWRVVKHWCRLCLIVCFLLWMQFLWLLPQLMAGSWEYITRNAVALIVLCFFALAAVWSLIKMLLRQIESARLAKYASERFRRSNVVFSALLEGQRKVDITPWAGDLQLGNASAGVQVTIASNPYCGPCARAHEAIEELLNRYRDAIGVTVRFTVPVKDGGNERKIAARCLLNSCQWLLRKDAYERRNIISYWFSCMDIEKFKARYNVNDHSETDWLLSKHEEWTNNARIMFTPTIFINGFELPPQYTVNDLKAILQGLLNARRAEAHTVQEAIFIQ